MRNTLIILIFLLLNCRLNAQPQKLSFNFGCGYGNYNLEEIKNYQNSLSNSLAFDAKVVENFPSNINYFGSIVNKTDLGFAIGPFFSYYSTGGRVHYSDYSGEYYNNIVLVSKSIGLQIKIPLSNSIKYIPEVYGKLSAIFVDLKSDGVLLIYDSDSTNWNNELNGGNTGFEFGFSYKNIITKNVYLGLFLGYEITNSINLNNSSVVTNWTGYRTGLYLSITI